MRRDSIFAQVAATVLGCATSALGSCSNVQQYTYEIELTTDREPQTVELWYEPQEGSRDGLQFAYALTLPQSYYAYRDNHHSRRQTTIGLLLDRKTFQPLTDVIASETGLRESLQVPRGQEGALKRAAFEKFRSRNLLVRIEGHGQPRPNSPNPAAVFGEMYDYVSERDGFSVYQGRVRRGGPDRGLPELAGYQTASPDVHFHCVVGAIRCYVEAPYRQSDIRFPIERDGLSQAPAIMSSIRKLLDQIVQAKGGAS